MDGFLRSTCLENMASECNFRMGAKMYLADRSGFQVWVRAKVYSPGRCASEGSLEGSLGIEVQSTQKIGLGFKSKQDPTSTKDVLMETGGPLLGGCLECWGWMGEQRNRGRQGGDWRAGRREWGWVGPVELCSIRSWTSSWAAPEFLESAGSHSSHFGSAAGLCSGHSRLGCVAAILYTLSSE